MGAMNAQIDPAALAATMAAFEQAGMKMDMTQETSEWPARARPPHTPSSPPPLLPAPYAC